MLLEPYIDWNGQTVAFDDGHGYNTAGKRTPYIPELKRHIKENEFNEAVVEFMAEEARRQGFRVVLTAPTAKDTALHDRAQVANEAGADIFVSVHYNAFDGSFDGSNPEGISIHIYPGHRKKDAGKLADSVLSFLQKGTAQKVRGVKEDNFSVLRNTNMPAILTENGFMDNPREALLMINEDFQREVAKEHVQGICMYFGIPYHQEEKKEEGELFFRTVTGSFTNRENAEKRMKELEKAGFESFLLPYRKQ